MLWNICFVASETWKISDVEETPVWVFNYSHKEKQTDVLIFKKTTECKTSSDLQMAPLPGMMSHLPSLRQKSVCTSQTLWHGRPSTLRYPASQTHSASPDHRLTMHLENSLHAWNLQGSARSPEEETARKQKKTKFEDKDTMEAAGEECVFAFVIGFVELFLVSGLWLLVLVRADPE